MPKQTVNRIGEEVKHWYMPLIVGIILIIIGFWTFSNKAETYLTLAFMFSLTFVIAGIIEAVFAFSKRDKVHGWGWDLALGLLTLLIGILMLIKPEFSVATLSFYIGFVVMFRSINGIAMAIELKNYGGKYTGLLVMGILGLIFSFMMIWNPAIAGMTIVIYTGIAFILAGIASVIYSLILRKIHTHAKGVSEDLMNRYNTVKAELEQELNS